MEKRYYKNLVISIITCIVFNKSYGQNCPVLSEPTEPCQISVDCVILAEPIKSCQDTANCAILSEPPAMTAGTGINVEICQAATMLNTIVLKNQLINADIGGTWSLLPSATIPIGSFNPTIGAFNPNNVTSGNYIFRYNMGNAICGIKTDIEIKIEYCCPTIICLPANVQRL
jgi:hypothetical protein